MRRFTAIAAPLFVMLMTLPPRACAMLTHRAQAAHSCCEQESPAVECGSMSTSLCCTAQVPADTTPYPVQTAFQILLPPSTVAVLYSDGVKNADSRRARLSLPPQHSPPGLVIAATTVLRI